MLIIKTRLPSILSFEKYAWGQAKHNLERLQKCDEKTKVAFDAYMDELSRDHIVACDEPLAAADVNDILSYEFDDICERLGLKVEF